MAAYGGSVNMGLRKELWQKWQIKKSSKQHGGRKEGKHDCMDMEIDSNRKGRE